MKKKDDIFEHDNSTIIATPLEEIMGSRFGSYSRSSFARCTRWVKTGATSYSICYV